MVKINCGECADYRTEYCDPVKCRPGDGYRRFKDPHEMPDKFCQECKARLVRKRSRKHSSTYKVVDLVCPNGCKKTYLHQEVRTTP